jgi:hypothetical protein
MHCRDYVMHEPFALQETKKLSTELNAAGNIE